MKKLLLSVVSAILFLFTIKTIVNECLIFLGYQTSCINNKNHLKQNGIIADCTELIFNCKNAFQK